MTKASDTANILKQPFTNTLGTSNYRAGVNAGDTIASGGNYNVTIGDDAGTALTTGDGVVAIGFEALKTEDANGTTTAIGYQALKVQNAGAESNNTAVGYQAGLATNTGVFSTFIGSKAGAANTTGQNTFIGGQAGQANIDGTNNLGIGVNALQSNTTGDFSVAIGHFALQTQNITNGAAGNNTAVGYNAGNKITTGIDNIVIGAAAGFDITDGERNVCIGSIAGEEITTADDIIAIGFRAGGGNAGAATTGHDNVCIGTSSGESLTTGFANIFMGKDSGSTTTQAARNICIGHQARNAVATDDDTIVLGYNIAGASNDFSFGKASNVVTNDFDSDANWSRSSDKRLKKNITDQKLGLDFINDLRTVKYNWKPNHELDSTDSQLAHLYKEKEADNEMNTTATMHNFIAQEVKTALDKAGVSDFAGWKEDIYGVQQVSREMFVIPLVKAIQELSTKNDALETSLTSALARIKALEDA